MSDDEYPAGVGSPYSDLEDLLWDADPAPDLADDLASHALYSPTFADDPGYELLDYHSDWEYYSDDYYDDDPDILKGNPQDGSPIRRKALPPTNEKRGKKRKLVETEEIPELDLGERKHLRSCMKGTVWAEPLPERDNFYVASKTPKIALMKDWKKKFGQRTVQPKRTGKEPLIQADESWANEMSLQDMGLTNERGNRVEQGDGHGEEEEVDEDAAEEGLHDKEISAADLETIRQLAESMGAEDEIDIDKLVAEAQHIVTTRNEAANAKQGSPPAGDTDRHLYGEKRRKTTENLLPSPPASHESTRTETTDTVVKPINEAEIEESTPVKLGRGQTRHTATRDDRAATKAISKRKREASTSPDPDQHPPHSHDPRASAGNRAKRVASSVNNTSTESRENDRTITTAASARPRRSRKK